ncbi:hypothetical protein MRB53_006622 [Persea americana]|uniref:Uncharacterized protein n=1 Tax=Persea americana TaxID=3435 RepID=A0ACC2MGN3_PERAE|nr:hypothetical protein MRB53_006622 [Persea americana]
MENTPAATSIPQVVNVQYDNSTFPTGIILDEDNYGLWSPIMEMRISSRNKAGFLTGTAAKPAIGDRTYDEWVTNNNRVKSWLIDSMTPPLMKQFIRLPTAKDIWDAVAKTFYDGPDETKIFDLNRRSFNTRQDGKPLSTYYTELVVIFQEIDQISMSQEDTVQGVTHLHTAMSRLRVHIFLSGLDSAFDQVRGEILRKDPKLDLEGCYAFIRKEDQQRKTMGSSPVPPESSVMIATCPRQGLAPVGPPQKPKNNRFKHNGPLVCNYCGEIGHSKSRCYEIVGYPEWWDFTKKPRKNLGGKAAVVQSDITSLSEASANVTQPGTIGKTYNVSAISSNTTWIIDTGASDHMTNDPTQVSSIRKSSQPVISTANGTPSPVAGEGPVTLSKSLTLDTVLVVPSLSTPSSVIDFQTPRHKLHALVSAPSLPNLEPRIFGCVAYVHIPKHQWGKLDPCAKKCVFVGYANLQKGYRCYDPQTKTLHVTLDVSFREDEAHFSGGAFESSLQGASMVEGNQLGGEIFCEMEDIEARLAKENRQQEEIPMNVEEEVPMNVEEVPVDPAVPMICPKSVESSDLPLSTSLNQETAQNAPIQPIQVIHTKGEKTCVRSEFFSAQALKRAKLLFQTSQNFLDALERAKLLS